MKSRNLLEGVGTSLLLLIPYYCKFLLPSNLEIFHLYLPISHLIGGLLVDMLVYSILATGFLVGIQYFPPVLKRIIEALFAGVMLWVIGDFAWMLLIHQYNRFDLLGRVWSHGIITILLLSGILAYFLPRFTQPAVRAIRLALAAFAFSALWIVPQLLYLALLHPPVPIAESAYLPVPAQGNSHPRIIWILFDELSYNQTFDHRAPGIEMPNFDRLRAASVSFSSLKPAGYYTDRIIPSLFLGRHIDQIRSTTDGELQYREETGGRWLAFDPQATLFALARHNGWKSGIDGWFVPYCRILATVVDECSWEPHRTLIEEYGASEEKSVLANAVLMPSRLGSLFHPTTMPEQMQIQAYRNIMAHARELIEDNRIQFVFLHIPVPHGPGIYDRRVHELRPGGTYLDRLVLADQTLGELMREIDAASSDGQTTVIVSSDHSWRINLSRHSLAWSEEEERACGGKFDDRPVLLVHFPGQISGQDIIPALPEMLEHDMIGEMLLGQIENPVDLDTFLTRQGR